MSFQLFNAIYNTGVTLAPFDTGALIKNGISSHHLKANTHELRYTSALINYLEFQEEGTKFFDGNKDFIKRDTVKAVIELVRGTSKRNQNRDGAIARIRLKGNQAQNKRLLDSLRR